MRTLLKGIICFFSLCVYLLAEAVLSLLFFYLPKEVKRRWGARFVRVFTRCVVVVLGIKVRVAGAVEAAGKLRGALLTPNHMSYIDGFAMASVFPLIFVSKSDLKTWPLIGWMTQLSGTIFIDRGRKNHLVDSLREMADTLAGGTHVLLFPEGTTTNAEEMLPFRSTFFGAAVQAGAPVVPVSIVYHRMDGEPFSLANRDRICWYGDMAFWGHFVGLLRCRSVEMALIIHDPIRGGAAAGGSDVRKDLSDRAHAAVSAGVQLLKHP